MKNDSRDSKYTNHEIIVAAKRLRMFFDIGSSKYVDVVSCINNAKIWTLRGVKNLKIQISSAQELGNADALTSINATDVLIRIRKSVLDAARCGDGRARNTLAHELGHGVLHTGNDHARLAASASNRSRFSRPYNDPEHHTGVFAPAFLINDEIAAELQSSEHISEAFGISLQSATIYYSELARKRNRTESIKKVRQKADEFIELLAPKPNKIHFLSTPCTNCGVCSVFPVGAKILCQTCDTVSDGFQDGDALDG